MNEFYIMWKNILSIVVFFMGYVFVESVFYAILVKAIFGRKIKFYWRPQQTNMKGSTGVQMISYDVKSCIAFCFLGCVCTLLHLIHMNGLALWAGRWCKWSNSMQMLQIIAWLYVENQDLQNISDDFCSSRTLFCVLYCRVHFVWIIYTSTYKT